MAQEKWMVEVISSVSKPAIALAHEIETIARDCEECFETL